MSDRTADGGQPGNRPSAPPPLDLVQDFVNTWDREAGSERFDSPANLARWLRARRLIGSGDPVSRADVRDAVELREALRQLLLEHSGAPPSTDAHAVLARCAAASPLSVRFDDRGELVLVPLRPGTRGAWAQVVAAVAHGSTAGTWPRLKACRADLCRWAFYDRSKNRSSHWCSMDVCGARAKMRRYRERHRGD